MAMVAMTLGSHGIYSQSRLTITTDMVAFTTKNFPFAPKIYLSVAILQLFFYLANEIIKFNSFVSYV